MASSSSSPMTGITIRPSPADQSTSKALACSDSRPSPQHVPPPRVLRRGGDADVVGHDVDEDTHAEPAGLGRERGEALLAAPLGVDVVEGDHVVAVLAAGLRGEQRREVDPVDARGRGGTATVPRRRSRSKSGVTCNR